MRLYTVKGPRKPSILNHVNSQIYHIEQDIGLPPQIARQAHFQKYLLTQIRLFASLMCVIRSYFFSLTPNLPLLT